MTTTHAHLRYLVTALAVSGACLILTRAGFAAEPAEADDDQGAEVQTRGPVHEAFAGVVTYNPEPGVVITKAPPEAIEEVPPSEKPEGDNVTWIPGYWAWDDERSDFLWISGVWRALPPGRQWLPGYWAKNTKGYQWTSGYWADAKATETTYLPPPPTTIERGPNIDPPSPDYIWTPGCWIWYDSRYAWRPGYWVLGRPDWDWCPAYYTYTPRGYVYVDGYWDYSVGYRGVLFAPVYFGGGYYSRHGYHYSPRIVIDLAVFPDYLFIRPAYSHYYFGDYYPGGYYHGGFYASFSYQSRHHGYDPIYAHRRWENRNDHGWEAHVATTYKYRRDHEDARPPRTWAATNRLTPDARAKDQNRVVATSFDQLAKRKDGPVRFQPVAKEEKQQISQRTQEVHQSRDDRRKLESNAGDASKVKPGNRGFQPNTAPVAHSTIVGPATEQPSRDRTPTTSQPTPRRDTAPKRDQPAHEPTVIRGNGQPDQSQRDSHSNAEPQPRRDTRPAVEPAPRREPPTQQQAPAQQPPPQTRREAPPQQQQQPAPPQTRREAKPEPAPAKEQPRDSDKGDSQDDRRGGQDQQGGQGGHDRQGR